MLINCDVGEGYDDTKIMPYIQLANIACGGHTGDTQTMQETIQLAKKYHVKIGAHPSYPDRENFGRSRNNITLSALQDSIIQQINALKKLSPIHHIKPHGSLYHDAAQDEEIFTLLLKATQHHTLLVPSNLSKNMVALAKKYRVPLLFEAFADRAYLADGNLMSRAQSRSVFQSSDSIIQQAKEIQTGTLTLADGNSLAIKADTICLHGDNPASVLAVPLL